MKYLYLIYFNETKLTAVLIEEFTAIVDEYITYSDQLGKAGHYIASHALQSVQTATTLCHQGRWLAMTDGPFAETEEQLGGLYLVGARDLDQALQIAAKTPSGRFDRAEV